MSHTCHALDCIDEIPEGFFMCERHWAMVGSTLKVAMWHACRERQEQSKERTEEYVVVARAAIAVVARKEQALRLAQHRLT